MTRLSLALFAAVLCASAPQACSGQSVTDLARGVSAGLGLQGRVMWVDGTANLFRTDPASPGGYRNYTTTEAGVAHVVAECKAAHVNTLVVDVKPLAGEVLYNSRIAPRMTQWLGRPVPDFDVLAAFVKLGHAAGMAVDASVNILSEGHKYFSVGPAYSHPEWQSMVYTVDRGLIAANGSRLKLRVPNEPTNPARPVVVSDTTTILGEEGPNAMVGLETPERQQTDVTAQSAMQPGAQLNVVMDAQNRVDGVVDSALLGDDPLVAPDGGHIVPVTRPGDVAWVSRNVHPGDPMRFDVETAIVPISQAPSEKVADFVNPLIPAVRSYELGMVREIAQNYAVDGIVVDRLRYSNLYNDFSPVTRAAFEAWLGRPVSQWPEDVYSFSSVPGNPIVRGPLFKQWLQFRAHVIQGFVADLAQTVHTARPGASLGTYVGSWYPDYYQVGVNWGSPRTALRYPWFTAAYPETGYAEYFNWVSTGCYYPVATPSEAQRLGRSQGATVEAAARLSSNAVADGAWVYAGIFAKDYKGHPGEFVRALNAAATQSEGWMVFDLSYIDRYHWWPLLDAASGADVSPPDRTSGLLSKVRSIRDGAG
ncbi:MAG: family 10 glycosylhydrolase [Armatimonadetes bacterium]|nr:family 10 glycosylhydrolase [Armatimonadota bacterium]MDE2205900.1 family 10 glycosylhydrolase [Armatimonadota bacterium]